MNGLKLPPGTGLVTLDWSPHLWLSGSQVFKLWAFLGLQLADCRFEACEHLNIKAIFLQPRALSMLGECSTTELHPQPLGF
jgi:hypothetical protein